MCLYMKASAMLKEKSSTIIFFQVIDEVADFKKSSGNTKGYFELKPIYYSHYNLFFYHYTREEQSKSEVWPRSYVELFGKVEIFTLTIVSWTKDSF